MATAPTLFWYQLDSGTLSATYFGQLNATVAELCSENAVTAPTAPWQNSIGGTLFSKWQTQIDTAVRSLCTALVVTEPIPLAGGSNAGQYQSEYLESLDGVVRALCVVAPSYEGPLDLVPGAAFGYSAARALSADMLGQPGFTLLKLDGGAQPTQAFSYDPVTGEAPAASIATFLGADAGTCTIWQDHSGNGVRQEGNGSAGQAIWTAGAQGGKPGFVGDAGFFAISTASFPNGAATVFFVGSGLSLDRDGDPSFLKFETGLGADLTVQLHQGANNAGGLLDAPPSGLKLWEGRVQFGQRQLRIDGAVTAFDTILDDAGAIGSFTETPKVLSLDNTCQLLELIVYPSYLSDGDATAIRQNIATFYGLTLS